MESILANTTPNELAPPSTSNSISGGVPGKKKTAASRVNPNLFRSHSPAMDFSLEAEEENLSKTKDKILGDQDLIDLAAARENPKLAPMVKNINVLVGNLFNSYLTLTKFDFNRKDSKGSKGFRVDDADISRLEESM